MRLLNSSFCGVVIVCALVFTLWNAHARIKRIDYVTGLLADNGSAASSAAGRTLIVPERHEASFHWLRQTSETMRLHDAWVRHVDYDNAPAGRETRLTSPYRWWLMAVARFSPSRAAEPGVAVEDAARWSDPILQIVLLIVGAAIVWRTLGAIPAAAFAAALATFFPLGSEYLPGMPDSVSLAIALLALSLMTFVAGLRNFEPGETRTWLVAIAGAVGGLALWTNLLVSLPALCGVGLAGVVGSLVDRRMVDAAAWRVWAISGALTVLVGFGVDHPSEITVWDATTLTPWYGLGWIGLGEAVIATRATGDRRRLWLHRALAFALFAVVAGVFVRHGTGAVFARGYEWVRLARLPGAAVATGLSSWLSRSATIGAALATLAPATIALISLGFVLARPARAGSRMAAALLIGALAVSIAIACRLLREWAVVDAVSVIAFAWLASELRATRGAVRLLGAALAVSVFGLGAWQLAPTATERAGGTLNSSEAQLVIERDVAQWLERHSPEPRPVVYAPPHQTLALAYYGNLRGIGTYAPENHDGLGVAVRLAGASTMEAAQAIVEGHQIRYIVVPSWDPFFDEFAQLYLSPNLAGRGSLLVQELRRLNLPPWLRPVPYQMPPMGGFEGQWLLVFEVVEEQSPVVQTSRLADYLVEMGDLSRAAAVAQALRRYPGNVGALAALAQVQLALNDAAGAGESTRTLASLVATSADHNLPVDRRLAVAIALARAQEERAARTQVERCLTEFDAAKLRALNTGALYNLVVLVRAFDLKWPQPELEQIALELLPADVRRGL